MITPSILVTPSRLLSNSITIRGFKHAFVSTVAACVARRGQIHLRNVPAIQETDVLCALLTSVGAYVLLQGSDLSLDCSNIDRGELEETLTSQIHGSLYLIPSLLVALGEVRFCASGGCLIGDPASGGQRPTDHIVHVLGRFGAKFEKSGRWLVGKARSLQAREIDIMEYSDRSDILTGPLVSGATKTALIASLGASVPVTVVNPYKKPDVSEMLDTVSRSGGFVRRTTSTIQIGRSAAWPSSYRSEHVLISDLSEIITYTALAVVTGAKISIHNVTTPRVCAGLAAEFAILNEMHVRTVWRDCSLLIDPPETIQSVDIDVTSEGIYSDHQPFFALMLLKGNRPARIREQVWKARFDYARELRKLGANITLGDGEIIVKPSVLTPTLDRLTARDLRAAAALLIAGIAAGQPFQLDGAEHLSRGYSHLFRNLHELGIEIEVLAGPNTVAGQTRACNRES